MVAVLLPLRCLVVPGTSHSPQEKRGVNTSGPPCPVNLARARTLLANLRQATEGQFHALLVSTLHKQTTPITFRLS